MSRRAPTAVVVAAVAVPVLSLAAGCTSAARPAPTPSPTVVVTGTTTLVHTVAPPPDTFTPAPPTSVAPLPPGHRPPAGERAGRCPYLRAGKDEDPTSAPNMANLEGDRVGRTTLLVRLRPIGCRFYYANPGYQAIADILPRTFASATAAHNALVLTARAGRNVESRPGFVRGVDGVRYQTRFYGPDGRNDWAFAFAKGRILVVVHTQQNNSELNAELIGRAIVGRF